MAVSASAYSSKVYWKVMGGVMGCSGVVQGECRRRVRILSGCEIVDGKMGGSERKTCGTRALPPPLGAVCLARSGSTGFTRGYSPAPLRGGDQVPPRRK